MADGVTIEPAELAARLIKCMGGVPPMDARPHLAALQRGGLHIELRYDWIKDWPLLDETVVRGSGWQLGDGQEWITFELENLAVGASVTND